MSPQNGNGDMHRRIEWMVPADESILRYMNVAVDVTGNAAIQTPMTIALNTGYSNRHVANRCRTLADHGLLERIDNEAYYRITDTGKDLLNGGVSPENLSDSG